MIAKRINTRSSIFVATLIFASALVPFGACLPSDPATGGNGSGGSGSGGRGSGGSGSGGNGSGGSGTGGNSGSGGSGSGGRGSGGSGSSNAGSGGVSAQPATFATAKEAIDFYCGGSGCHTPGGTEPTLLQLKDEKTLYTTLTTFKSVLCGNRVLVKPSSPQDSAFYLAQAGMCDPLEKMPLGCSDDSCTAPDYLEGIRQWIAAGAPGP